MSELENLAASTAAVAGALVATVAEWEQQAEHPSGVMVFALFASGGVGALAFALAVSSGVRLVRAPAAPKPRRRPAPAAEKHLAPPLRPPGRHATDRTPPGEDLEGFRLCGLYADFERGNRWSL